MAIKAVIFDMDGVITDSEPLHTEAFGTILDKYGVKRTPEVIEKIIGLTEIDEWVYYKQIFPQIIDNVETLIEKKQKAYVKLGKEIKFFPGFKELFSEIKKNNFKIALTTSNRVFYINYQLPKEIINSFDAIISGNDITKGKPYPEPYAKTINKLNLNPNECIVIEDSVNGIKSAKAAGAYCIAVTNTFPKEKLQEADLIINSLTELTIDKIKQIGEG